MFSKLIFNKSDYTHNFYISNLDLINKYNIHDIKKIPSLKNITIILPFAQFLENFMEQNVNESDLDVQIKSIVLFYLLTLNLSFINVKKLKFVKSKEYKLSLKLTLTDNSSIMQFLMRLFIEKNEDLTENLKLLSKKKNIVTQSSLKSDIFIFSFFLTVQKFSEIDLLLNKIYTGINTNELLIKVEFRFTNFLTLSTNYKNLIKNCPNFWLNS